MTEAERDTEISKIKTAVYITEVAVLVTFLLVIGINYKLTKK